MAPTSTGFMSKFFNKKQSTNINDMHNTTTTPTSVRTIPQPNKYSTSNKLSSDSSSNRYDKKSNKSTFSAKAMKLLGIKHNNKSKPNPQSRHTSIDSDSAISFQQFRQSYNNNNSNNTSRSNIPPVIPQLPDDIAQLNLSTDNTNTLYSTANNTLYNHTSSKLYDHTHKQYDDEQKYPESYDNIKQSNIDGNQRIIPLTGTIRQHSTPVMQHKSTYHEPAHSSDNILHTHNITPQDIHSVQLKPVNQPRSDLPTDLVPMLQHSIGYKYLVNYLYTIYAEHYLMCAKCLERFVTDPSIVTYQHIYNTYIKSDSMCNINVSKPIHNNIQITIDLLQQGTTISCDDLIQHMDDVYDHVLTILHDIYLPQYKSSALYTEYIHMSNSTQIPSPLQFSRSRTDLSPDIQLIRSQRLQYASTVQNRSVDLQDIISCKIGFIYLLTYLYGHNRESTLIAYKYIELYKQFPSIQSLRLFHTLFCDANTLLYTIRISNKKKSKLFEIVNHPQLNHASINTLVNVLNFIQTDLFTQLQSTEYVSFTRSGAYKHYLTGKKPRQLLKRHTRAIRGQLDPTREKSKLLYIDNMLYEIMLLGEDTEVESWDATQMLNDTLVNDTDDTSSIMTDVTHHTNFTADSEVSNDSNKYSIIQQLNSMATTNSNNTGTKNINTNTQLQNTSPVVSIPVVQAEQSSIQPVNQHDTSLATLVQPVAISEPINEVEEKQCNQPDHSLIHHTIKPPMNTAIQHNNNNLTLSHHSFNTTTLHTVAERRGSDTESQYTTIDIHHHSIVPPLPSAPRPVHIQPAMILLQQSEAKQAMLTAQVEKLKLQLAQLTNTQPVQSTVTSDNHNHTQHNSIQTIEAFGSRRRSSVIQRRSSSGIQPVTIPQPTTTAQRQQPAHPLSTVHRISYIHPDCHKLSASDAYVINKHHGTYDLHTHNSNVDRRGSSGSEDSLASSAESHNIKNLRHTQSNNPTATAVMKPIELNQQRAIPSPVHPVNRLISTQLTSYINARIWYDYTNTVLHVRLNHATELPHIDTSITTRFIQIRILPGTTNGIIQKYKSKPSRQQSPVYNQSYEIKLINNNNLTLQQCEISIWSYTQSQQNITYIGQFNLPIITLPEYMDDSADIQYRLKNNSKYNK